MEGAYLDAIPSRAVQGLFWSAFSAAPAYLASYCRSLPPSVDDFSCACFRRYTRVAFGAFLVFLHQLPPLMIALFLDGVFIFYFPLMMASIFRALFLHEPALIINCAGIQILTLGCAGRCFMSWPEIGTIAEDYYRNYRYFQIHPKRYQQYLSRLSSFKRISIRYWTRWSNDDHPPFSVAVCFLDRPGVEIFQQLTQLYAWELDYYCVYLQVAFEDVPR